MKIPCSAYLLETSNAPYFSAMLRRVEVLEVFPHLEQARVRLGTAMQTMSLDVIVPFARLASNRERALALFTDAAVANVFATLSPASDEKSASEEKAGAVAGNSLKA